MASAKKPRSSAKPGPGPADPFRRLPPQQAADAKKGCVHVYGRGYRCDTDGVGFPTPQNRGPLELVLDASEGFIPLWQKNTTLRWRFREETLKQYADPEAAKARIRQLMTDALLAWGDAVPVRFSERKNAYDFEVVVRENDDCDTNGCVLASAFFPDQGRHELTIYPKAFEEPHPEQVETLAHEFGHVFGLRHFFAKLSEKQWPSVVFGKHRAFSIMNYGSKSRLTATDRSDLKKLYAAVWAGTLTEINGTPIKLVKPYHLS